LLTVQVSHGALRSLASLSGLRDLRELYLAHSHVPLDWEPPADWYPTPSSSGHGNGSGSGSDPAATGGASSSSSGDSGGTSSIASGASGALTAFNSRGGPLDTLQVLQCLCVGPMVNLDLALARLTALTSLILVDCGLQDLPEQVRGFRPSLVYINQLAEMRS
jgi:hypothetical protein